MLAPEQIVRGGEKGVGVRSCEQGRPRPQVGVVDGQVPVGEDLACEHRERVVLRDVVAGEQGIADEGGYGQGEERDADEKPDDVGVTLAEQTSRERPRCHRPGRRRWRRADFDLVLAEHPSDRSQSRRASREMPVRAHRVRREGPD